MKMIGSEYHDNGTSWAATRLDLLGALYMFCARHHGGQWSRGYRILSRIVASGYRPGPTLTEHGRFESDVQRWIYRDLLKFKNDV